MLNKYFKDSQVKPEFDKEFISLFNGWLGQEKMHRLDEVSEEEWSKFNSLLQAIYEKYKLYIVDLNESKYKIVKNINEISDSYSVSMNKKSSQFTQLIIPELECVLTEEWDYTYILWHKNSGARELIVPLVSKVGLFNFCD